MKVYDYNNDFGGNYYQPMIQYLNTKDTYGPFHKRTSVYLPDRAEICSQKYSNMRYKDKSSAKQKLDTFLEHAYTEQIKELNGTTAAMRNIRCRRDTKNSKLTPTSPCKIVRDQYVRQINSNMNQFLVEKYNFNGKKYYNKQCYFDNNLLLH